MVFTFAIICAFKRNAWKILDGWAQICTIHMKEGTTRELATGTLIVYPHTIRIWT